MSSRIGERIAIAHPPGWDATREEPETTDAGPDTLSGEPTQPYVPTFTGDFRAARSGEAAGR